jgi:hypothetical protein
MATTKAAMAVVKEYPMPFNKIDDIIKKLEL